MKLLSVILTLYFLLLTAVPCTDSLQGHNTRMEQTDHQDHEGEPDGCSPLCHCNCCHVPVVFHSFSVFQVAGIEETLTTNRSMPVPDSLAIPLFRPPQV